MIMCFLLLFMAAMLVEWFQQLIMTVSLDILSSDRESHSAPNYTSFLETKTAYKFRRKNLF